MLINNEVFLKKAESIKSFYYIIFSYFENF